MPMSIVVVLKYLGYSGDLDVLQVSMIDGVQTITTWDETVLGPQPTQVQIDAARPAATMAIMKVALENVVQKHLDDTVKVRGYDGIMSACTYANSSNAVFKAEGLAAVAWRDAVWSYCYTVLAAVQSGTRAIPTEAELIAGLPVMVW